MKFYKNLYHYTTHMGYKAVTASPDHFIEKLIFWVRGAPDPSPLKPSLGEGGMDAFHGPGWYFTDIIPGAIPRSQIAPLLWDGAGFNLLHKTEYWLSYRVHIKAVKFCKKHVYLVSAKSKAQIKLIQSGKTPDN
ncbi:MAG TPA: hypothetical protein VGM07_08310 [Stellaceae bacterium]